jgi:hypothetical protein
MLIKVVRCNLTMKFLEQNFESKIRPRDLLGKNAMLNKFHRRTNLIALLINSFEF